MKRVITQFLILLAVFLFLPAAILLAQSGDSSITVGGLSPLLYLVVTLGLTIGSSVLTMLGTKAGPFGATIGTLMKGIKTNYISYDNVDLAAKTLLKNIGVPQAFANWAADIIGKILTTIPDSSPAPSQVVAVAASQFAALPTTEANALTAGQIPANMMAASFAKKRIATTLLQATPAVQRLGGSNAVAV